ncbi:unnamed protein product, partial [marine sediment metagenome]
LSTVFEEHKRVKTGPNYLEMQIKRDLSVASFFTGHSSKHFIGKGDHVITVFLSDEDVLLTTISTNTKQERNILLMNLVNDKIALFAPLHSNIEWKKFGYSYFNPEDRAFFASVFKQNYLATDVIKTVDTFSHIYM